MDHEIRTFQSLNTVEGTLLSVELKNVWGANPRAFSLPNPYSLRQKLNAQLPHRSLENLSNPESCGLLLDTGFQQNNNY